MGRSPRIKRWRRIALVPVLVSGYIGIALLTIRGCEGWNNAYKEMSAAERRVKEAAGHRCVVCGKRATRKTESTYVYRGSDKKSIVLTPQGIQAWLCDTCESPSNFKDSKVTVVNGAYSAHPHQNEAPSQLVEAYHAANTRYLWLTVLQIVGGLILCVPFGLALQKLEALKRPRRKW